jgi:hypothetical protein
MSQRATAWLCWLPRRSGAGVVIVGASGQTMRTTVVLVSGSINSMLGASPPLLLSDQCAPPRPVRLLERRNFQDRRCGWTVFRPPPGWRLIFHPVGRPDPRPWPYVNAEALVFRCGD